MARTTSKKSSRRGGKSSGGMKDLWEQAKEKASESSFDEAVPVGQGNYQMQLVHATINDVRDIKTLITKWCVLDEEDSGAICTHFQQLETVENMVWAQRMMIGLGLDVDAVDPDEDDDILEAFNDAITDGIAAKVVIKEKDGYTNMYPGKAIDIDEDDLFDPKEALGQSGKKDKKQDAKKSSRRGKSKKEEKLTVEEAEDAIEGFSKEELRDYIKEHDLDVKIGRRDDEDTIIDAILDAVEAL